MTHDNIYDSLFSSFVFIQSSVQGCRSVFSLSDLLIPATPDQVECCPKQLLCSTSFSPPPPPHQPVHNHTLVSQCPFFSFLKPGIPSSAVTNYWFLSAPLPLHNHTWATYLITVPFFKTWNSIQCCHKLLISQCPTASSQLHMSDLLDHSAFFFKPGISSSAVTNCWSLSAPISHHYHIYEWLTWSQCPFSSAAVSSVAPDYHRFPSKCLDHRLLSSAGHRHPDQKTSEDNFTHWKNVSYSC